MAREPARASQRRRRRKSDNGDGGGPEGPLQFSERGREILDAAAGIFYEKGYAATGIQDIADEVGILKGSLYHHIESKDDLLFAIIDEVHQSSLANLEKWQQVDGDVRVRIRAFLRGHLVHFARNFVKGAVFFHDFRMLSGPRREVIMAERDRYDGYLRELIREGQATGVICPDADPKLTSLGIFGMLNGFYTWYDPEGDATPEEIADTFADTVLGGLSCTPGRHTPGHRRRLGALAADAVPGTER